MVTLLVALTLTVAVPATAVADVGSDCKSFYASSVPYLHPSIDAGEVELCDEDGDGAWDTATFYTNHVPTEGEVSVTDETKQRWDHQDRETQAETRVSTGVPGSPIVYHSITAEDEGNDGQVDRVDQRSVTYTRLAGGSEAVTLLDGDGDRVPDGYGLTVCSVVVGCQTPGPRDIPELPDRVDLPDTVLDLGPAGYVP